MAPTLLRLILAALLPAVLPSTAQDVAYTDPRGFYTVKVPGTANPGSTARTYLGMQLLPDHRFVGLVQNVNGNALRFDSLGDHSVIADPVRPCYLHVLDGPGRGFITNITGFRLNDIVCADNPGPWLQPGTRILIRPHSNLSDILGANNRFGLASGTDADSADNVVVWDAASQQEQVYNFHSTRNRWEKKDIVANASTASIRFPQGFYLVRRSTGMRRIVLSGEIGSESVLLPVRPGAGVFSLPVNLTGSLDAIMKTTGDFAVASGPSANSADILTFEEPVTGQQRGPFYHLNREGLTGWREVGVDGSSAAIQPMDFLSTLVYRRHGGPGRVLAEGSLEPPAVPRPPLPPNPEPGEVPFMAEFPLKQPWPPGVMFTVETSTDLQAWTAHASVTLTNDHRVFSRFPPGKDARSTVWPYRWSSESITCDDHDPPTRPLAHRIVPSVARRNGHHHHGAG